VEPEEEGLFKSFTRPTPKPTFTVPKKDTKQLFSETETALRQTENYILDIDSEINKLDEQLGELESQKSQIKLLRPIRFNLGYLGATKHLIIKAGSVDSISQLKTALAGLENIDFKYVEVDDRYSVVIAAHASQRTELESRLRGRLFTEFEISGFEGTPEQVLNKLENEIKLINGKKDALLSKLKDAYKNWNNKLLVLDEELENERDRHDVFSRFGETNKTKVITGWILTKHQDRLKRICSEGTNGHAICHFRDPGVDEEVPVKLHNPKWAKPFEVLTTLFATPKYNEIDPTLLISIPFVFFFGLMLGDAGYGAVILVLCLFGYFHLGKIRPIVKQASYIGIFMGISTIIFGLLMGSVFGDLIPRLIYGDPKTPLYSAVIFGFQLPYDPIRNPIILLQVSLIVGLFYITMSVASAAGHNIKSKNYKDLLLDQVSWLFFLIPFGLLLIFYAFFKYEFSSTVLNISYIGVLIGIILLFINKKALFFFDLTGYLGDTLSFARLLALGLATAGIAMTINIIAELVFDVHVAMIVLVIILLFFAHLINFVLQALGAGIHSLRLQYVEFFARCYEGGGKPFQPFMAKRFITKSEPKNKG
jgi:V/A-type H+-transporting ATPase subunit I